MQIEILLLILMRVSKQILVSLIERSAYDDATPHEHQGSVFMFSYFTTAVTVQCFPCCFKPWGDCHSKCLSDSLSSVTVIWVDACISGIVSQVCVVLRRLRYFIGKWHDVSPAAELLDWAKWACLFWLLTQDILCLNGLLWIQTFISARIFSNVKLCSIKQ